MADKYLADINSIQTEVEFTTASAGASDAGKGVGLDDSGRIDSTMMPVGVGPTSFSAKAFENISAGMFVNLFLRSGELRIQKADATDSTKPARCFVLDDIAANETGVVYIIGNINSSLSGLTIGDQYYLNTGSPGSITNDPSVIPSGGIIQPLGLAISATELIFDNINYRVTG